MEGATSEGTITGDSELVVIIERGNPFSKDLTMAFSFIAFAGVADAIVGLSDGDEDDADARASAMVKLILANSSMTTKTRRFFILTCLSDCFGVWCLVFGARCLVIVVCLLDGSHGITHTPTSVLRYHTIR